jgi:hypothetical protein
LGAAAAWEARAAVKRREVRAAAMEEVAKGEADAAAADVAAAASVESEWCSARW